MTHNKVEAPRETSGLNLMKNLILWLAIVLSVQSIAAQKTISEINDAELRDARLSVSKTFAPRSVTGRVVGVRDGDTATVLGADRKEYKFRLDGIDAPELKMDFGQKSKKSLSDLIFGKEVTIRFSKIDQYERYVGTIFVAETSANLEQIKAGMAWHYVKYRGEQSPADRKAYASAETKAKAAGRGLWAAPNPVPPWDYRQGEKAGAKTNQANQKYAIGSRGGCYYINASGEKIYVSRKLCAAQ